MLVISCHAHEALVVGRNLVTVLEIEHNCVRLGIEAPGEEPSYYEVTLAVPRMTKVHYEDSLEAEESGLAVLAN